VVRACLAKDPNERFQTAADLKRSLRWAVENPEESRRRTSSKWPIVGLSAACLALASALAWALLRGGHTPGPVATRITRLTRDGTSRWPALSPDGRLVAYSSRRSGAPAPEIYVQLLNGHGSVRLSTYPAGEAAPQFNGDVSKVYFVSTRSPAGIYEVPSLGGDPRLFVLNGDAPSVSPDGKWLAYLVAAEVFVRPLAGGESRSLAVRSRSGIVWAPDSNRIAFLGEGGGTDPDLTVTSIEGARPTTSGLIGNLRRQGMLDLNRNRLVAWLPGGDLLFTAPYGEAENVWRIPMSDLGSAEPVPVTLGASGDFISAHARAGKLVFTSTENLRNLWTLPADLNAGRVLGPLHQLTDDKALIGHQDISPDGRLLAYCSRKGGSQGVWLRDLQLGTDRLLVQSTDERDAYAHLKFSPDGSALAATLTSYGRGDGSGKPKGWEIRRLEVATGESRRVSPEGAHIRGWSPDGRHLLAWSGRQVGQDAQVASWTSPVEPAHPFSSTAKFLCGSRSLAPMEAGSPF
jgi:Tol biopolymer transport system component